MAVGNSFEEVLGLGFEGWIEVFHVKKAEGYSKKREFCVQRRRGVRDWPCLDCLGSGWARLWKALCHAGGGRGCGSNFPGRFTGRGKTWRNLHLRKIALEDVR